MLKHKQLRVAFIEFQLGIRGTQGTIWQYAYHNQQLLGNKSIIFTRSHPNSISNDVNIESINYFLDNFEVFYLDESDINTQMKFLQIDIAFIPLHGRLNDNTIIPTCIPTITHLIFDNKNQNGTIQTAISDYISKGTIEVLPNIIEVHETSDTLHDELNIPRDAIVFGRYGGYNTFDIEYVKSIILKHAKKNKNTYFIFMHTQPFSSNINNIIYLNGTRNIEYKTKFINTCDAMIHARKSGETFGMSCGEFALKNKPVLTSILGDTAHIALLGYLAIIYDQYSLEEILNKFNKNLTIFSHNYNKYSINDNIDNFNTLLKKCIKKFDNNI